MQKRLTFDDTPLGRTIFATLWDGITFGASDNKAKDRPRRSALAKLQRTLMAISAAVPVTPANACMACRRLLERPTNARVLNEGSQTITLSGADISLINELLDSVAWGGASIVDVANLDDALGTMPDLATDK